jgi:phosphoribosyl 1,2-cyclic phosphodiesterase
MRQTGEEPQEFALTKETVLAARAADSGPRSAPSTPLSIKTPSQGACLHLHILGSGSKGNCAIIEGSEGYVMVDCGFSKRTVLARMDAMGLDPDRLVALILTHEHTDHLSGVGVLSRAYDLPVYATCGTARVAKVAALQHLETFNAGEQINLAGMDILTFSTSHDAADPIGMRFQCGVDSVGYATDTGVITAQVKELLAGCRLLALESNHDPDMLKTGPYPGFLKSRIAGNEGHLSNVQSASALTSLLCDRLELVVGMHLSQSNNSPSLAHAALKSVVVDNGHCAQTVVASQGRPLSIF